MHECKPLVEHTVGDSVLALSSFSMGALSCVILAWMLSENCA